MTFIEICKELRDRLIAENKAMNEGKFQTREKFGLSAEWQDTTKVTIEKNAQKIADFDEIIKRVEQK